MFVPTTQSLERFVKPRLDKELLGMMFFSNQAMERFVKPRLDKELLGKERDLTAGQMMRLEAVRTNTIIMSQEENIIITMMMVSIILSDGFLNIKKLILPPM